MVYPNTNFYGETHLYTKTGRIAVLQLNQKMIQHSKGEDLVACNITV